MASTPPAALAGPSPAKKGRTGGNLMMLTVLIGAGLAVAYPALAAFFIVGLAPMVVSAIVERPAERHLAKCVGLLNLAGVIVVGLPLFKMGVTMPNLVRVLSDPTQWAAIYGAALAGWGIHFTMAAVSVAAARRKLERDKRIIALRQKRLILEWGPEVADKAKD